MNSRRILFSFLASVALSLSVRPAEAASNTIDGRWDGSMRLLFSSCDGLGGQVGAIPISFTVSHQGKGLRVVVLDDGNQTVEQGVEISRTAFSAWTNETSDGISSQGAFTVDRIRRNRGRIQLAGTINFGDSICALYFSGNVVKR